MLLLKYILCFLVIFLTSCTQDPLENLPQSVQNRINELLAAQKLYDLRERKQEVSHIFGRITSENGFWQVSPGDQLRQVITANVFMDEDQFDDFHVELTDPRFENESYSLDLISDNNENENEKKYLFEWTPSQSFLKEHLEKCIEVEFQLQTSGSLVLERPDTFKLLITNYFQSQPPRIQPIDLFTEMKEGDEEVMRVHVYSHQPPVLILDSASDRGDQSRDLNPLLNLIQRKKTEDENIWEFQYDLRAESDSGMDPANYALNMFASSVDGISDPYKVELIVFNRVLIPQVIGPSNVTLAPGSSASIFVQVLDPLASGKLSSRLLTEDLPVDFEFKYDTIPGGLLISLHLNVPDDIDVSQNCELSIEILNEDIAQEGLESVVYNIQLNFNSNSVALKNSI